MHVRLFCANRARLRENGVNIFSYLLFDRT
jgi:hypothetical protein